jgi:sorbitol-specific phosphotransferase system component IIC
MIELNCRPLTPGNPARKEGYMYMAINLIISVIAGFITHYLCKWLDRKNGGK